VPPSPILQARLTPPRLPAGCLVRPALLDRVLGGAMGRLVTVVAGAGYGKSTLLVQALGEADSAWVWCGCDERMQSPQALLGHLAAGLAARFPGFGARLVLAGSAEEQVAALAEELTATVAEDVLFVLDDLHALAGGAAEEALPHLLADLPPFCHLALAGRREPALALGRLRAAGEVVEIGEEALSFSLAESRALLSGARIALSADEVAELHRQTEGWPAGLLLAAQAGLDGGLRRPRGQGALFDYLAEEVFVRQPADVRAFLLSTCVLERFSSELAAAASGQRKAERILERLLAEHLFTQRLAGEGEWYRYHQLFAAFLARTLAEEGPEEEHAAHRAAAAAWLSVGEHQEAVRHLLSAADPAGAVAALEPVVEQMATSPDAPTLAAWLEEIPRTLWEGRPALRLAEATLLFGQGRFESATHALEDAIELLIAAGEHERAAGACAYLINAYGSSGNAPRAVSSTRHYLARIDRSTAMLPIGWFSLSAMCSYAGDIDEAEREFRHALSLPAAALPIAGASGASMHAFFVDFLRGRLARALETLERITGQLLADEATDPLAVLPLFLGWRGIVLVELGRYDEALAVSGTVMDVARRRGLEQGYLGANVWLVLSCLAGLERWEEFEFEASRAAALFAPLPSAHTQRFQYEALLALRSAQRGDQQGTAEIVASTRRAASASVAPPHTTLIILGLIEPAISVGLASAAQEMARDALASQSPWFKCRAHLLSALVHLPSPDADPHLHQALALTAEHGYEELWTRKERRHAGPLLARALAAGLGPAGLAERLLAACGGEVVASCLAALEDAPPAARARLAKLCGRAAGVEAATLERLSADPDPQVREAAEAARARIRARPRPPVQITTLGRFAIAREGVALEGQAGGRPRVRALLAALLSAGGAVHRELLCEWLWPELPIARGLRALYSALHELRRLLAPEAETDALVRTEAESYRLVLGERDLWDAGRLLALWRGQASAGAREGRLSDLLAAEALWGGPYLPEFPYEPWTAERRRELEGAHLGLLEELGQALLADGQAGQAIGRFARLLELEPESERAHRGLMRAYAGAGERALALRQFHACRALLRHRLGVEPSPETRALYGELL